MSQRGRAINFPIKVYAHRGGSLEGRSGSLTRPVIENTLTAFRQAMDLNVDLLELDVQMTRDGHAVIFHDDSLERLCGQKGKISDFDYANLPRLSIPSDLTGNEQDLDRNIPLFEDLLKISGEFPLQVDVKRGPEALVKKVGALLCQYGKTDKTVWGSFLSKVNSQCELLYPEIPLFYDFKSLLWSMASFLTGSERLSPRWRSAAIIPHVLLKYSFFCRWIMHLKEQGTLVVAFTVNSPDTWRRCLDAGVDGYCTDSPSLLQSWLSQQSKS